MLAELRPASPPAGFHVSTSPTAAELLGAGAVQHAAYADPEDPATTASRLARNQQLAGVVVVARHGGSGDVVGAGIATPQRRRLCEVAAVAVRAELRRRGLASAMTSALSQAVLDAGNQPFLQAEPAEVSLYRRVGYEQVGEVVFAELPE